MTNALMQQAIDYTPYEGWRSPAGRSPRCGAGEVVMRDGRVQAEPGSGQFLARGPYDVDPPARRAGPTGSTPPVPPEEQSSVKPRRPRLPL